MMGLIGMLIEGRYTGPKNARVDFAMNVDSPLVQMMSMQFSNPALLGDGDGGEHTHEGRSRDTDRHGTGRGLRDFPRAEMGRVLVQRHAPSA